MKIVALILLGLIIAVSLPGCAVPPASAVASLLVDGVSYFSTEKSVHDRVQPVPAA